MCNWRLKKQGVTVWIYLSEDTDLWPVAVNIFMKLHFSQRMVNYLTRCLTVSFSKDCFTWKYILYSIVTERLSL